MEARKKQIDLLPHISDCHACRGNPLENGERCQQCGNPMWKFDWLVAE
jgi:rRNA maturation endonuclease Nob1